MRWPAFVIGMVLASGVQAVADREDPTKPERWTAPSAAAQGPLPTLSSVLISPERKLAVIDGRVFSEGESSGGIRVWKIKSDRVVVSLGSGVRMTLRLDETVVNKEVR